MKLCLLTCSLYFVFILAQPEVHAQRVNQIGKTESAQAASGDYQSVASGNWNKDSTWAKYTEGVWVTPASPPDFNAGVITIRAGHIVTMTSSVTYDQVVVEGGGQVTVASGVTHTLANGPGTDLSIKGIWLNRGGSWTMSSGSTWSVGDSGTYIHNTTSGISTPLDRVALSSASNFVYRGSSSLTPASSFSGRSYGNLTFEGSSGLWTCTMTGGSALTVNGNLKISAGVTWNTGGFSGSLTVRGTTLISGTWTGSGTTNLGTHCFMGSLTIDTGGKYSLATTGSVQGNLVVQGDLTNNGTFSTPTNRIVVFSGQNSQTISGAASMSFKNGLTSNNSSGVTLGCPVFVDGTLQLNVGILRTGANTLTLGSGGVLKEDGSSTVLGRISTTRALVQGVNECFGNLGIEIQVSSTDLGPTTVTRVTGTQFTLNAVMSILRCFEISSSVNSNFAATLRFHYKDNELKGVNKTYLRLFKSTDGGSVWRNVGGSSDPSTNTVILNEADSFSWWTAGEVFPAPTLSSISPSFAALGDNLDITVEGADFVNDELNLAFSGTGITVSSLTLISSTQIKAHIAIEPGSAIGSRDVLVTTLGGTSVLRGAFEVTAPRNPVPILVRVLPSTGVRAQSLRVTLQGGGFVSGTTLAWFGDSIYVLSLNGNASTLTALISIAAGASLGPRNVVITNPFPGGGFSVLHNAFSVVNPVPTVTASVPSTAICGQSLSVLLTGTDFIAGVPSVSFGEGINVDSIAVVSGTQLQVQISIPSAAPSGQRDISVTNDGPGGGTATLVGGFCVTNPSPRIMTVTPSVGLRGRRVTITVTGKDFLSGVSAVSLGTGISIDSIRLLSSTQLVACLSIGRDEIPGLRPITVKNPGPGGGSSTLPGAFEVQNPSPTMSGISPHTGVRGQTLDVVTTGTDCFDGVSGLEFGTGITVNSTTCDSTGKQLRANIIISHTAGTGDRDVCVRNAGPGGGSFSLKNAFTVENPVPTLLSVSPAAGARGQTLDVNLSGTNFIPGTSSVSFGVGITVNSITVNDLSSITANITVSSDAVAGARTIVATNSPPGGGSGSLPHVFNIDYRAPGITIVSPSVASRGQRLQVVIEGSDFYPGATDVNFGPGIVADSTRVISSTHIEVNLSIAGNAALGARQVTITNSLPGGGAAILPGGFSVQNPIPVVIALTPAVGPRGQSFEVKLTGMNFIPGETTVHFGADITIGACTIESPSEAIAAITIPVGSTTGTRDVAVSNPQPGGGTYILFGGFAVTNPAPTIASVAPLRAGRGSTLRVTIVGAQFFAGVTSLSFGDDISVTDLNVVSPTEVQASIAIHLTAMIGPRTVTVTNPEPGGGSANLANAFTVTSDLVTAADRRLGVVPDKCFLEAAYPNPFNPATKICFGLAERSNVILHVYNLLGHEVIELARGERSRGVYEVEWFARNEPTGVYLVRLASESLESPKRYVAVRKVVLVK